MLEPTKLRARVANAAFTFRGYNTTNLGKSAELLAHPVYGPHVEAALHEASVIASHLLHHKMDLVERVTARRETTDLTTYSEDIALIVSMSLVQLKLLRDYFDVSFESAKLAFGYSLGEPTALVAAGVFTMENVLRPLLLMSQDSVDLAHNITMAILFSRGPELDFAAVQRACLEITLEGKGVIAPMTVMSPNSALLLGQDATVDRFKELMKDKLPDKAHLRKNPHRWPPLHTPITWQKNIPNRSAVIFQNTPGGLKKPSIPLVSSVTGECSFTEFNGRELMVRWVDHPQRLWEMVYQTLASGVELCVHVGPDPNLIPATFKRISDNVAGQLAQKSWSNLGLRAMSSMVRRPWLSRLLTESAVPLRAPFVEHINLEDWLLHHAPVETTTSTLRS